MQFTIKHIFSPIGDIHLLKWIDRKSISSCEVQTYKSFKRNLEKSGELIIFKNLGIPEPIYTPTGKPTLADQKISITHSYDYIGVYLSTEKEVGIDIEKIQHKIERIEHKFLHKNEHWAKSLKDKTIIWSCKESVYKYFDINGLDFQHQIEITPIDNDKVTAKVYLSENQIMEVQLMVNIIDDMVLTYTL